MINAKLLVSKAFNPVEEPNINCLHDTLETPAVTVKTNTNTTHIRQTEASRRTYGKALTQLARDMADNNEVLNELIKHLRHAMQESNRKFYYDLSHKHDEERECILSIAFRMRAFISNLFYNPETHLLQGQVADIPEVISFINGRYLEVAVTEQVKETVAEYAQQNGFQYSISQNVLITTGTTLNELDLFVEVDGARFAIEVKSGGCNDYPKYYQVSMVHGLLPDHFLMVSSNVTPEMAEIVHEVLQYYVTDWNFKNTLLEMLQKGCRKEEKQNER